MNRIYRLYFLIPTIRFPVLLGKAINKVLYYLLYYLFNRENAIKKRAEPNIPVSSKEKSWEKYVVSITSFPARINQIYQSLHTIYSQEFPIDKVILWLASSQFPDQELPDNLKPYIEKGLEIKYCEDLKSHKKYFYAFDEYPDSNIITLDDDLLYDKFVIKNIIDLHKRYPQSICTNRAHRIKFDKHGNLLPYRKWEHNTTKPSYPTNSILPTGGAGTLYPPGSLHPDAFSKELINKLCPFADDIWLKMMAFINGTSIVTNKRYNKDFIAVKSTQDEKLVINNSFGGGNDEQLMNIIAHYSIDKRELKV